MKKIEIARALAAAREALGAEAAAAGSAELDALLELPGLGRRRARQLYGELGVTTLEELAAALLDGRAHALPGFGADACERLRADLQQHFARSSRLGLAEAEAAAAPLLKHLRDGPGVERVEVAGSVRRRSPTVGDIDLLIVSSRPAQVIRHFVGTPETARVAAMDTSRASIVLRSGLRADVRVVPRRCFGATLQFLTGSPTHNAEVRQRGLEHGFRVSEYGIFSVDSTRAGARRTGGQCEDDIYASLGLQWIPPELREGHGEVERAAQQRLPALVSLDDLRGDMHVAARLGAGPATADALARACHARGYEYCVVLRHARGHGPAGERHADSAATVAHADAVRVLHGIIVPIGLDGSLEAAESELHAADIVVVEVRSHLRLSRARMTERLVRALDDSRVDVLTWPPARTAGNGAGADIDSDAVFTAAAARGVALELVPGAVLTDADEAQVRRAAERGVRFALASDARALDALDDVRFAVDAARRGWMEADSVINTAPLPELERWLLRRASNRVAALASV